MLGLLVAGCLALITLDLRSVGPIGGVRRVAATVTEPIVGLASAIGRPFGTAWNGVTSYDDVTKENEALRAELDRLRTAGALEDDAQEQLDEILAQEGVSSAAGLDRVLARVVGGSISNFDNTVRIDRGSAGGVEVGMTVITQAGLVGRVVSRTSSVSVVELADTRGFTIGVREAGSDGDVFVARGQGSGRPLRVTDIGAAGTPAPAPGKPIVSSGLGVSAFPPDVFVGSVRRSVVNDVDDRVDLEIDLAVDLDRLGFVTVLEWLPLDIDARSGESGDADADPAASPAAKAPK